MRKIITLMIITLFFVGLLGLAIENSVSVNTDNDDLYVRTRGGPTNVSGLITKDTTWTANNSPYIITGDTTLMTGNILTIHAGTIVKFKDNTKLTIRGFLYVLGNKSNRVIFTNEDPVKTTGINYHVDIDELNGGLVNITYGKFEHSNYAYGALVLYHEAANKNQSITDTEFIDNKVGLSRGDNKLIVKNCTFKYNYYGTEDFIGLIQDSVFYNNTVGAFSPEYYPIMYNCSFIKNEYGI